MSDLEGLREAMLKAALAIANQVVDYCAEPASTDVDESLVQVFCEAKAAFLVASAAGRHESEDAQQERFRQFLATNDPTTLLARDLHSIEPPYAPSAVGETPVYEAQSARLRRLVQANMLSVTAAEAQVVEEPACKKTKQ